MSVHSFWRVAVVCACGAGWAGGAAQGAEVLADAAAARLAAYTPEAVKAAYLVNFIRFTTWPFEAGGAADGGPFVIAVANDRALEDELMRITAGQTVRGRALRVVRVRSPRDLEGCHVAWLRAPTPPFEDTYVSPAEGVSTVGTRPVLSISDQPGFIRQGGVIQMYLDGTSLRFEISADRARAAGLSVSSRLLALSRSAPTSASAISAPEKSAMASL